MDVTNSNSATDWPTIRRRVWDLHQQGWEDHSIAETLGITVGAVHQWVKRAEAARDQHIATLAAHFRQPSDGHIHVFSDYRYPAPLKSLLAEAAQQLDFHFAVLQGGTIMSGAGFLAELATLYTFPEDANRMNWDAAADWMGDLGWLAGGSDGELKFKGFLLLYQDPMGLLSADAVAFALALSVLSGNTRYLGLPFHLVMGPLESYERAFINLMKVADHLCWSCPVAEDPAF